MILLTQRVYNSSVLLLRACQGEQNSLCTDGSPERGGRRGRRATLADSASELPTYILDALTLNF